MITEIKIKNFAIIEEVQFEFGEGLNVLTGETGSGKSIIVSAINVLAGGRTSPEMIRTGETLAVIEARFELPIQIVGLLQELLTKQEIESLSSEVWLRREIHSSGRTRAFIDDQSINAKILKLISSYLVDIHMQGEQQTLNLPQKQLEFLDEYCGNADCRNDVASLFNECRSIEQKIISIKNNLRAGERSKDYLNFQINEIETINPLVNEDLELISERTIISNQEKVRALEDAIYQSIYESDESITSQLVVIRRHLNELSNLNNRLAGSLELFDSAVATLIDIAETFRSSCELKNTSHRLNEIEERLAHLEKLKRKYGSTLNDVLSAKNEMTSQLLELSQSEDLVADLEIKLNGLEKQYLDKAQLLSGRRSKCSEILSKDVTSRLPEVSLEKGIFNVAVTTETAVFSNDDDNSHKLLNKNGWSVRGIDTVEFNFTANEGEDLRPLIEVASGGELSRLMLTLYATRRDWLSRETLGSTSLVFDEIDSGISGRVAESVGRKLADLSQSSQIICITHQTQIARFARNHYKIAKTTNEGRTRTHVIKLEHLERVTELANLMAADGAIPEARQTAELLINTVKHNVLAKEYFKQNVKLRDKTKDKKKHRQ